MDREMPTPSCVILFVESGSSPRRTRFFEQAHHQGFEVALVKKRNVTWEREKLDYLLIADTANYAETIAVVRQFATGRQLAGVLTYLEAQVPLTAQIAHALNLCGIPVRSALILRRKNQLRSVLCEAGLVSPRFKLIGDPYAIKPILEEIGLPAVIKPNTGFASVGVIKLEREQDAETLAQQVAGLSQQAFKSSELLVESFIDGPEVIVEVIPQWRGDEPFIIISDKLSPMQGPCFLEEGYLHPSQWPDRREEIEDVVYRVIAALHLERAILHLELRLTREAVYVIEVAARPAGGEVPRLIETASGIDLAACAIAVASGQLCRLTTEYSSTPIGLQRLITKRSGCIRAIRGVEEVARLPGFIEFVRYRQVGERIALPPQSFDGAWGYVMMMGSTLEIVKERLAQANSLLQVDLDEVSFANSGWS